YLAFGPEPANPSGPLRDLSTTCDLREAARNLFSMLHELDALSDAIAVAPIPHSGLGEAINDRLKRAAAPRP
ncbi:MAG: Sua5 family C-terminal domain-containing protein, partial [Devosia sp.]